MRTPHRNALVGRAPTPKIRAIACEYCGTDFEVGLMALMPQTTHNAAPGHRDKSILLRVGRRTGADSVYNAIQGWKDTVIRLTFNPFQRFSIPF